MYKHVEPEDLLRFADGELTRDRTSEVGEHVRNCEQCRNDLDIYVIGSGAYTAYHIDVLKRNVPPPPQPWADLDQLQTPVFISTGRKPGMYKWFAVAACLSVLVIAQTIRFTNRGGTEEVQTTRPAPDPSPRVTSEPVVPPQSQPQQEKAIEPVWQPGPAEELKLFVALNRIGADVGEAIEISRKENPSQIVVTGIGLGSVREAQVRSALESIPGVTVRFVPAALPPASLDAGTGGSTARRAGNPLQQEIERRLGGAAEADAYTDRVLADADAAAMRAHALDKLAQSFSSDVESAFSSEQRTLLRDLVEEHVAALVKRAERLQTDTGVLFDSGIQPSGPPACTTWQSCTSFVLSTSRRLDSALGDALAGSEAPNAASLRNAVAEWFAAVQRMAESIR